MGHTLVVLISNCVRFSQKGLLLVHKMLFMVNRKTDPALFKCHSQFVGVHTALGSNPSLDITGAQRQSFISLWKCYKWRSCSLCGSYYPNHFHTSAQKYKQRRTADEKKLKNPIRYPPKALKKKVEATVKVWKNMTVQQLAEALGKDVDHVFEAMIFVNNTMDYDSSTSAIDNVQVLVDVVKRSGQRCVVISNPLIEEEKLKNKDVTKQSPAESHLLVKRPPVITIMGHVDHGKTTLLDSLRHTSVVSQEFGGITQHIGAFTVILPSRDKVTFLDTPGHAAFTAMRARGAQVTDIIVLVVAADDGVMQQTVESIQHASQANVPIIVAINKIDKSGADIERCKRELLEKGIQLEDFGGDVQAIPISALKGTNLDILIDAIIAQAELMELKAYPKGLVEGYIIESCTDPGRGKLSTAIIQRGTLRKGAFLVAGNAWAKVRAMFDDRGQHLQEAPPSTPVEIIGWKELPSAGDELLEVESERRAKEVVDYRLTLEEQKKQDEDYLVIKQKAEEHLKVYKAELEQRRLQGWYRAKRKGPRQKEILEDTNLKFALVLKGDVDGSVEAILDVLETYHSSICKLDIIHYGVGAITEQDVTLAEAFQGIIYGFNVAILDNARTMAKTSNVAVKQFNIIYRLVDDIKEEINLRLPMLDQEQLLGEANVLQEFIINDGKHKIPVAGCRCTKGTLKKSGLFRVVRGQQIMHEGQLYSMRHLKNEVDSVKKDVECGLRLTDGEVRFQPGDTIICYERIKVPQKTDWDPGF